MNQFSLALARCCIFSFAFLISQSAVAEDTVSLPIRVIIGIESVSATLEIPTVGDGATIVLADQRVAVGSDDPVLKPHLLRQLKTVAQQLADRSPQRKDVMAGVAVGDSYGFTNAELQTVILHLRNSKARRLEFEFSYFYKSSSEIVATRRKVTVPFSQVRPQFDTTAVGRYAVMFGEETLAVTVLDRTEQATSDSHGSARKEWRAKVVLTHELDALLLPPDAKGRRDTINVLDLAVGSLLFLDKEGLEASLKRIATRGLDAHELIAMELHRVDALEFPQPAREREAVVTRLKTDTAGKKLDLPALNRQLYILARMIPRNAANPNYNAARVDMAIDELISAESDQRQGLVDELKVMAPLKQAAQLRLATLLKDAASLMRVYIVELLEASFPLAEATIFELVRHIDQPSGDYRELAKQLLLDANSKGRVFEILLDGLIISGADRGTVNASRRALVKLGTGSASAQHQLFVAFQSKDLAIRAEAAVALMRIGNYQSEFLLRIVELIRDPVIGREAGALLLHLKPTQTEVAVALSELMKDKHPNVYEPAARVLNQMKDAKQALNTDILTLIRRCLGRKPGDA